MPTGQSCTHARLIERLISVIGCLLEHVEGNEHTRELAHPDCQACLDVRSANELLDEFTGATADPDRQGAPP